MLCYLQLISPVKAAPLPEHPLEPVNTSGPRATLRTFMTNAENTFVEFRQSGYRTKKWMRTVIYEQAIWQWVSLLLTLMVGAGILIGSWQASNWLKRKLPSESRQW